MTEEMWFQWLATAPAETLAIEWLERSVLQFDAKTVETLAIARRRVGVVNSVGLLRFGDDWEIAKEMALDLRDAARVQE